MPPAPEIPKIHHYEPIDRRRWPWIAGAALAVVLVFFGLGIYRFGWNGRVTRIVTEILPYPAAIVEGRVIRYSDYRKDLEVLERFYKNESERSGGGLYFANPEELKQRVLDRLIKDQLAYALAESYRLVVSSDDVKRVYDSTILDQTLLADAGGKAIAEAKAAETLDDLYGLRPSQFKMRILHPFLTRQKLEVAIHKDLALNVEKLKKAEAAHKELVSGKSFSEVALAYSEDSAVSAAGGDRGMISRGMLPAEVESAAFALKDGEISDVLKSGSGYHILLVTDRQEVNGEILKLRLREILIRPVRLDDYLEVQKKTASITIFVQ